MNFKKTLCSLISAGVLFGSLGSTACAVPMKSILGEGIFQSDPIVSAHIFKLQEFMAEERAKLVSEGRYNLENVQRMDSLVFGIFCYFCYKKNLTIHIEQVVKQRSVVEHREDMDVIESILPENPKDSEPLYERFEIGSMSDEEVSDLVRFIRECTPKRKATKTGKRRKPGRELRQEMHKGLQEHQSGYDRTDY